MVGFRNNTGQVMALKHQKCVESHYYNEWQGWSGSHKGLAFGGYGIPMGKINEKTVSVA